MAEQRPEDDQWDPSVALNELEIRVNAVGVRYADNPLNGEFLLAKDGLLSRISAICTKAAAMDAPDSPELFEALGRGLSYLAGRIGTPWDAEVLRERMGKAQDTLGERLLFLLKRLRSIELAACAYASGQLRTSEGALIEQLRGHLVTGGVCTATRQSRNGIFVRTVEALSIFLASDLRLKSVTVVALHEGWNPGRLAWFLGATWNDLGDKLGVMAFDRAVDRLRSALLALSATVQAADGDINRLMQITQSMLDQRPRS